MAFVTKAGPLVPYPQDGKSGNCNVCSTIDVEEQIHQPDMLTSIRTKLM